MSNSQIDPFFTALLHEEELVAVIKGHLYIEKEILSFLDSVFPVSKELDNMDLDYFNKILLTVAMGVRKDLKPPLKYVGTLRNLFAHNLNTKLTHELMEAFYNTFSSEDKQIIYRSFDNSRKKVNLGKLKNADPQTRFVIYIVALRGILREEIKILLR